MDSIEQLLQKWHLSEDDSDVIKAYSIPAIGFTLSRMENEPDIGTSRVGGLPDLPLDFDWPHNGDRALDFILQLNFAELTQFATPELPDSGLISFFFDVENQPWGYDPFDLNGFKVVYHSDITTLERIEEVPDEEFEYPYSQLDMSGFSSLPSDQTELSLELLSELEVKIEDYATFASEYERLSTQMVTGHRIFGHPLEIQGDMRLEAQLVTNGLYCGNPTGYEDPRAEELGKTADEWKLLLQLDSDGRIESWGDEGKLYFWIREEDLRASRFENVWMGLQCY